MVNHRMSRKNDDRCCKMVCVHLVIVIDFRAAEILAFLPLSWGPGDMCISPSASSSSPAKSVASRTKVVLLFL